MKTRVWIFVCLFLVLPIIWNSASPAQNSDSSTQADKATKTPVSYKKHIQPFLAQYCTKCHGGDRPRGDLALDQFRDEAHAMKDRELWQKVATVVRSGEMPPRSKAQPTSAEKELLIHWVDWEVNKVDCNMPVDPGQVTLRRLNKTEYNNTIRDLIGVKFKPAKDFPSDDVGYGFDNIGDVLTLSPLLVEKYLAAADTIVEAAFKDADLRKKILIVQPKGKDQKARLQAARVILSKFAYRAYRRPVSEAEVERLTRFVTLAEQKGDSFERGIKLAVKAMLVSPHFLFHIEEDRPVPEGKQGHRLNPFELASRLSYFLWSSMPDAELFRLAESGDLHKPDVVEQQVKRMMADPKSQALVKNFAGQWLQMRKLQTMTPDPDVFPTFSEKLRSDMIRETELFFEHIMREDRSILEFLDADYTFVNERLAKHYGLPGIQGDHFRKVNWSDDNRGGILTQASILTVTSNPTRTSPVSRGKWILENIFNAPPPPPVPDAGELSEDKKVIESASLRKRLEMHRANPSCASCHQRMDPLGFALENFDGIGSWRNKDGKFPIDASGTLPTGQTFNGPKELRQVLLKTKEAEFRKCLVEKMLTYALGRGLEYYDRCVVNEVCDSVVKQNNRFSSLVLAIVKSDPFQMRRGKRGTP